MSYLKTLSFGIEMSAPDNAKTSNALFRNADTSAMSDLPAETLKPAAVLIPLVQENDNWSLLFIRRAHNDNDRHSGQVAFPGGRKDPDDETMIATAFREMHEEIGVADNDVELLGTLENYRTISSYVITPVVAIVPWPTRITMQKDEVARVFTIPLAWLRDKNNLQVKPRTIPPGENSALLRDPVIYYDKYDGELLWGATARMTLNFTRALDTGTIVLPTL